MIWSIQYLERATELVASLRATGVARSTIGVVHYDRDEELGPTKGGALRECVAESWTRSEDQTHFQSNVTHGYYALFNHVTHMAAAAEIVRYCVVYTVHLRKFYCGYNIYIKFYDPQAGFRSTDFDFDPSLSPLNDSQVRQGLPYGLILEDDAMIGVKARVGFRNFMSQN